MLLQHPVVLPVLRQAEIPEMSFSPSGTGFAWNKQCPLTLKQFKQQNHYYVKTVSTQASYLKQDGITPGIAFPMKFVAPNVAVSYQWTDAKTLKDAIVLYCSGTTPESEWLNGILNLRVGVEYSACSRNRQRITLLEALQIAFPYAAALLQEAYNNPKPEVISTYLEILKATGIDYRKRFLL